MDEQYFRIVENLFINHIYYDGVTILLQADLVEGGSMTKEPSKIITQDVPTEANARSSKRILMAEDNIVNQKVAALQIKRLNFQVDVVANGQEAINVLQQIPYDLVLMDCQMPEMDGFETTREIRKREALIGKGEFPSEESLAGNKRHIPIIAMTANAMEEDREKYLKSGMDDFISKPLNQVELEKVLEKWMPRIKNADMHPGTLEGEMKEEGQSELVAPNIDSSSNAAVLTSLRELAGGGPPEVFSSLIHEYLQEGHECFTQMAMALEENDANALKKAAHKFKGSSQIIGAERLAEICKALEDSGCTNVLEEVGKILDHFFAEYQLVEKCLKAEMETIPVAPQSD